MQLLEHITQQIQQQGPMPFVEFMHKALYMPNYGYYSANLQKFGRTGDFITAPELSPLFAKTLANQCQPILTQIDQPIILEFGAGSGRLCVDLLIHLEQLNCLPAEYHILEISADLCQRQKDLIQQLIPHLAPRFKWLTQWPTQPFSGIVIANEVFDAMPIHKFLTTQDQNNLLESVIAWQPTHGLVEQFIPCENLDLIKHVQHILPTHYPNYLSEANLWLPSWLQQCYNSMQHGVVLIIDYGFPRHEYYHPDRNTGTLMCHYQHTSHTNPLIHIGEQDITAHVDFTHVAEAADDAGFTVAGFTNQAAFLLANGLLNLLSDDESFSNQQAVKQLTHPHEMGELFKVMALTKQIDCVLAGFQWHDKRASL